MYLSHSILFLSHYTPHERRLVPKVSRDDHIRVLRKAKNALKLQRVDGSAPLEGPVRVTAQCDADVLGEGTVTDPPPKDEAKGRFDVIGWHRNSRHESAVDVPTRPVAGRINLQENAEEPRWRGPDRGESALAFEGVAK